MSGPSSRILALLPLLQVHRDWPGDVLAQRLEVSPRTVRRDVDLLRELGYRVEALRGPGGGYRLAAGSDLPPLLFDDEQAVAIALALAIAPASGADIAEAAARHYGSCGHHAATHAAGDHLPWATIRFGPPRPRLRPAPGSVRPGLRRCRIRGDHRGDHHRRSGDALA